MFSRVSIFCPWTPLGTSVTQNPWLVPLSKFLATPVYLSSVSRDSRASHSLPVSAALCCCIVLPDCWRSAAARLQTYSYGNVSIIRGFDNPISSIRVSRVGRVSVMVSVRDSVK